MKPWIKWLIVLAVLGALAAGVFRALAARKAQNQAVVEATQAKPVSLIELVASDVVRAEVITLQQGLAISGSLKAVNTAFVKAKVAGELKGLSLREGDAVRAGQIVATVDTTEYEARVNQAQRQANAAKSQIDIAQRQYDNNKALVDQGFISKTALDTSLATLEGVKATYEAALAGADLARKSLDDAVVRAPISGTVAQRLTQPGERVAVDGRVIEITDLSRLELEASLSAADAMAVRTGQIAVLQIEGSTTPVTAKVLRINPNAQAGSRNVLAYLGIDKPQGLRQGLFAQGTLGTAKLSELAVPVSTVRTDKPNAYVQVVENERVVHKPVQTGQQGMASGSADGQVWVTVQGLSAGAVVIRGAVGSLIEGTTVKFTVPKAAGVMAGAMAGARAGATAGASMASGVSSGMASGASSAVSSGPVGVTPGDASSPAK
jgi:membrane fusion protein, multidrug efflux system